MRAGKAIKWFVAGLAAVLVGSVAVLYVQASRVPPAYRPPSLTRDQRVRASRHFYRRLMDFNNSAQEVEAFTWSVRQGQVNEYLASLDEIAAAGQGVEAGAVHKAMSRMGLADPAVAFEDGTLVLMVRDVKRGKIISAELSMAVTDEGRLRVGLAGARVGLVPIPDRAVSSRLEKLKKRLARKLSEKGSGDKGRAFGGLNAEDVGRGLAMLITAIDSRPVDPEVVVDGKAYRITEVRIDEKEMTFALRPEG